MYPFRKKNFFVFWFVLLSFIFLFCIFLPLFVVHFHFFFEKAHLASGHFYQRDRREISLVEVPHFYRNAGISP